MPIAIPEPSPSPRSTFDRQAEYHTHLAETLALQADLQDDVDDLIAQEGYDAGMQRGLREWAGDTGSIWRALRPCDALLRYDRAKTLSALLCTLSYRIAHNLHLPVPPCPSASSPGSHTSSNTACGDPTARWPALKPNIDPHSVPPFAILPCPTFTHPSGQPIALISIREVLRDDQGSLDGLKEWVGWGMEMTRRVVRDFHDGRCHHARDGGTDKLAGRAYGTHASGAHEDFVVRDAIGRRREACAPQGMGCVLVVNAAGAGYRNLEVELLPTLLSLSHTHFPSLFTSVYIVNSGWAQRSMWAVVQRMLPKSAVERIRFLEGKDVGREFGGKLPKNLGGDVDFSLTYSTDTIQQYHSTRASYQSNPSASDTCPGSTQIDQTEQSLSHTLSVPTHDFEIVPSRTASCSSIADLFHTAHTSPVTSLHPSRRGSIAPASASGYPCMNAGLESEGSVQGHGCLARPASGVALARSLRQLQMTQHDAWTGSEAGRQRVEREGQREEDGDVAGMGLAAEKEARHESPRPGQLEEDEARARTLVEPTTAKEPLGTVGSNGMRKSYAERQSTRRKSTTLSREASGPQAAPVVAISSFDPSSRAALSGSARTSALLEEGRDRSQGYHSAHASSRHSPAVSHRNGQTLLPEVSAPKKKNQRSAQTSPAMSPMQRIKSLSDFHLYLSPSRLAHIDLLSDSESDEGGADAERADRVSEGYPAVKEDPGRGAGVREQAQAATVASSRHSPRNPPMYTGAAESRNNPITGTTRLHTPESPSLNRSSRRPSPPTSRPILSRDPPTRRTLHPLILDPEETDRLHASLSIAQRRARPPLRVLGVKSAYGPAGHTVQTELPGDRGNGLTQDGGEDDCARSYSGAMGLHHVEALRTYQKSSPRRKDITRDVEYGGDGDMETDTALVQDDRAKSPGSSTNLDEAVIPTPPAIEPNDQPLPASHAPSTPPTPQSQPLTISPYSRTLNPYYGYPALLLPATKSSSLHPVIVPRHPRRRNRDLVKTLLFLAMLRLQNVRDLIERKLGLRSLGGVPWARLRGRYLDFAGNGNGNECGGDVGSRARDEYGTKEGRSVTAREGARAIPIEGGIKVGPEEGLERVENEQRRLRSLLSRSHSSLPGRSSANNEFRTSYDLHHRHQGGITTADILLHSLGWLGWSSTYSAEWVWAIVGLVLFRGAWVRAVGKVVGAVGTLRAWAGGR